MQCKNVLNWIDQFQQFAVYIIIYEYLSPVTIPMWHTTTLLLPFFIVASYWILIHLHHNLLTTDVELDDPNSFNLNLKQNTPKI